MNRAHRNPMSSYLMFSHPMSRGGVRRDLFENYVRLVEEQPERISAGLVIMAETERLLETRKKRTVPAGWEEFIESATTINSDS